MQFAVVFFTKRHFNLILINEISEVKTFSHYTSRLTNESFSVRKIRLKVKATVWWTLFIQIICKAQCIVFSSNGFFIYFSQGLKVSALQ